MQKKINNYSTAQVQMMPTVDSPGKERATSSAAATLEASS